MKTTTKESTVADVLETNRKLKILATPRMTGAKRAILCKDALWLSPAMYELLGFADPESTDEEIIHAAKGVPFTYVNDFRHEYRVAFAPD
jgi:hypothetical protein